MPGAGSVGLCAQFSAGIEDARPVHGLSQLVQDAHRLLTGQVFALFVITVAAAEVGLAMAIILRLFRDRASVDVDEVDLMKW